MPKYYIDFESWIITARDEDEAMSIALKRYETDRPDIAGIELSDDYSGDYSLDALCGGDTRNNID